MKRTAAHALPAQSTPRGLPETDVVANATSMSALRALATALQTQVRESDARLAALTTELTLTEDRERRALARDLHDDLGQVMAILKIKLTALYAIQDMAQIKSRLREIETLIDIANKSVRSLALQLSPPVLHSLGLVAALGWLAEEMERIYGLVVSVHDDGKSKHCDDKQRITLFRAARELLVNVAKHAKTGRAIVTTLIDERQLTLAVSDSGIGFETHKALNLATQGTGLGLVGVRERIALIGGEMHLDSSPGEGTTITLTAPLANAGSEE